MHYLSQGEPSRAVRFVNTRCPKCQRVTSYLSLQTSPTLHCTWTDCAHSWTEPGLRPNAEDPDDVER